MSEPRADVALLVDFTDLRHRLCPEGSGGSKAAPPAEAADEGEGRSSREPAPAGAEPSATEIARHLLGFADRIGRVALARAYADWSRCAALAQEIHRERLEPVLVPGTDDGEDRSHIRLVVDALESLFTGDEPDAFILVTGDPTLLPLVQRLRADGSEVVIVAPAGQVTEEMRRAADRFFGVEDVMSGVLPEPAKPRTWRGARAASGPAEVDLSPRARGTSRTRERPPHPTPVTSESGFDAYDWEPFIRLIDELEHRLPFVGVRYLVNKVLGPNNCGIEDARLKRDLINRAVENDMIEMYPVGNVGDRADPVTACRLNRQCLAVIEVLGETTAPQAPPEHAPDTEDGEGDEPVED